jgi:DNA-binding transcriptional LysR family regulator
MDTLGAIDVFLLAAERLSFAEAGRRLGLSSSAVGKSIARLELRLGVRLFHRTTRRVSLTAEGALLYERGRRIREEFDDVAAAMARSAAEPQGRLRLSLPTIGYRFLAPHLSAFTRAHPKVQLDLDFSDRMADLAAEGLDAAIRSGDLPDSTLMSRKLGNFRFMLYASPTYIAERGEPDSAQKLARHALIRYRRPDSQALQPWALEARLSTDLGPPAMICTNMEAVLAATVSGMGISSMPDFLAAEASKRGDLIPILCEETGQGAFWLIWISGRRCPPKLRAFADFAAARLFPRSIESSFP